MVISLILCLSAGCGNTKSPSPITKKYFNTELRHAIYESKEAVQISSKNLSKNNIDSYNDYLKDLMDKDYFCRVLLDNVVLEENGKDYQLKLSYKPNFFIPLYFSKNIEAATKTLIEVFSNDPYCKVTMIFDCDNLSDEAIFSVLDSAEINLSSCPFEADNVYFERYDKVDGKTIVNLWLGFSASRDEMDKRKNELELAISSLAEEIKDLNLVSREEKYKAVFNLISSNVFYDHRLALETAIGNKSESTPLNRSSYGALVDGRSVCSGFARGYKAICDKLELPCLVVGSSKDGISHAFNVIELNGKKYFVDPTAKAQGESDENSFLLEEKDLDGLGYVLNDYFIIPERL